MDTNNKKYTPRDLIDLVKAAREGKARCRQTYMSAEIYAANKAFKDAAYEALREALTSAKWGRHGSTVFITDRSTRIASGEYVRTLYVQDRPVATCCRGWVEIIDPAEGERMRTARRENLRARDKAYKAERDLLIRDLKKYHWSKRGHFGVWRFTDGQLGGVFRRVDGSISVSANTLNAVNASRHHHVLGMTYEDFTTDLQDELFLPRRFCRERGREQYSRIY